MALAQETIGNTETYNKLLTEGFDSVQKLSYCFGRNCLRSNKVHLLPPLLWTFTFAVDTCARLVLVFIIFALPVVVHLMRKARDPRTLMPLITTHPGLTVLLCPIEVLDGKTLGM